MTHDNKKVGIDSYTWCAREIENELRNLLRKQRNIQNEILNLKNMINISQLNWGDKSAIRAAFRFVYFVVCCALRRETCDKNPYAVIIV